jgi:hypothetical protein
MTEKDVTSIIREVRNLTADCADPAWLMFGLLLCLGCIASVAILVWVRRGGLRALSWRRV